MAPDALFIADLHLQVSEPATVSLARNFLQNLAPQSPQLFILGDLVEYWIGDDADDGGLDSVFNDLLNLSTAGTSITLMHGNRDFLLGQGFADRIGATLVTDDHLLLANPSHRDAPSQTKQDKSDNQHDPILLMHGDTLCTDDHAYQNLRKTIRSAPWQHSFLEKSVDKRRAFADDLRQKSQSLSAQKEQNIMDVNNQTVIDTLQSHQVTTLVHGHTHKAAQHDLEYAGVKATRIVVGDWHADHAVYAVLENANIRLETYTG